MDIFDPVVIAAALIAGFGGFFLGWLLSTRLLGGCLLLVAGLIALVVVIKYLFGGSVGFIDDITQNLSGLVAGHLPAVITFVAGFGLGMARRRRRDG